MARVSIHTATNTALHCYMDNLLARYFQKLTEPGIVKSSFSISIVFFVMMLLQS